MNKFDLKQPSWTEHFHGPVWPFSRGSSMRIDVTFVSAFLAVPTNCLVFLLSGDADDAIFDAEELTRDDELNVFTREPIALDEMEIEDPDMPSSVVDALEEKFIFASSAHGPQNGVQIVFGNDGEKLMELADELARQIQESALIRMLVTSTTNVDVLKPGQALALSIKGDQIVFTLYTEPTNDGRSPDEALDNDDA